MHERHGAECMAKPGMLRTREYEIADPELADSAKALDLRSLNQVENQSPGNRDKPVDWIRKYFETTFQEIAERRNGSFCI